MKSSNLKRLAAFVLAIALILPLTLSSILAADSSKEENSPNSVQDDNKLDSSNQITSVDDLSGKKIGVQLGTTGDVYISDYETDGSGTKVERYSKGADAVQALRQGKIDAIVIDELPAKNFVKSSGNIKILEEEFANEDYAISIAKNNTELLNKVNSALSDLKSDGTLQAISDYYIQQQNEDSSVKPPYTSPEGLTYSNGTLKMATNAYFPPYEFYASNKIVGIDPMIATAIADKLNMKLEIVDMAFDSIITAVSSGKVDMGMAGMTVTEERKKNINFSDSYTTTKLVVIVNDQTQAASSQSLADHFKSNFIEDSRYVYILKGLSYTVMISFFAALIGIVIGFLVAVVRVSHDKNGTLSILNILANIYLTIVRGTPTMVQLLIIYYVIFGSYNINKVLVAIMAFGFNSGAYVAEIFRSGIMAIDNGQFEASTCLGLTNFQTFIHVILPQAFKNILPALANEFIVLLKETSISGYIGLNDLTRGGDIIRSITYDAFFPLIAVAIIYLILVDGLSRLVKILERRLRKNER